LEVDEQANVISYEEYHPYGTSAYRAGRSEADVSLKRYRYTAKERDEETGFYYYGARHYACWLGRWTSADPIGVADGLVRYSFLRGNPIKFVDRTGNYSEPAVAEHPSTRQDMFPRPDKVAQEKIKQVSEAVLRSTREAVESIRETMQGIDAKLTEFGRKLTEVDPEATKHRPNRRGTARIPKTLSFDHEAPGVSISKSGKDATIDYIDDPVTPSGWTQVKDSPGIKVSKGKVNGQPRTERQWAKDAVAADLKRIGEVWHKKHPDNPIQLGDISLKGGGPLSPHSSHREGVDVDIGFVRADPKAPRRLQFDDPTSTYSQELTRELMELILEESTLGVQYIFFADKFVQELEGGVGLSKKSNASHTKHFHVRFGSVDEELPKHLE
jgi:RHS repeat-associated protein